MSTRIQTLGPKLDGRQLVALLEAALERQNLQAAWKRVKANKGAGWGRWTRHRADRPGDSPSWSDIRQALGKADTGPVRYER